MTATLRSPTGALAPSQAFDPGTFLDGFERFDLSWQVEEKREAAVPVGA